MLHALEELRVIALALSRKRSRFAFPDDFVAAAEALQRRLVDKHDKETNEGAHLRALREIRVRAAPSWDDAEVQLGWWFIKDADPADAEADWPTHMDQWLALFDQAGRFRLDPPAALAAHGTGAAADAAFQQAREQVAGPAAGRSATRNALPSGRRRHSPRRCTPTPRRS